MMSKYRLKPARLAYFTLATAGFLYSAGYAQQESGQSSLEDARDVVATVLREGSDMRNPAGEITDMGQNHRRLRLADASGNERGLVQLQTGLNYKDEEGNWQPTDIAFELVNGNARAWKGPHKVSLSATPNTAGAVQLRLPDGQLLSSHVYGLAYTDQATGQSVMIAEVKDAQGFQVESNQILYADAFDGVSADLSYTYTTAGFEQDVILRGAIPMPEEFGLSSSTSRLEVWTEFEQSPRPSRVFDRGAGAARRSEGVAELDSEDELDFGSMRITPGRSFLLSDRENSLALMLKGWVEPEQGRSFLVEAVLVPEVLEELNKLPASNGQVRVKGKPSDRMHAMRKLPRKSDRKDHVQASIIKPDTKSVAGLWSQRPGVVLDYFVRNGSYSDYIFYAHDTTVVTGPVYLTGTTTFDPGTDIKFTSSGGAVVDITGTVNWLAEPWAPVILTASDDSSLGGHYASSSGNPTTTYYGTAGLRFNGNAPSVLKHLRVSHLKRGIELLNLAASSTTVIRHAQFYRCESAIKATRAGGSGTANVSLQNVLMNKVLRPFSDSSNIGLAGQHVTSTTAEAFIYNSTSTSGTLLNSVLAGVTNQTGVTVGTGSVSYSSPTGVFTTTGGGECYLPGDAHRDVGTTSIDSTLLADLKDLTVEPPRLMRGSVSLNTELRPLVARDAGNPDRGYHYAPVDYLIDQAVSVSAARLTIGPGVVLAHAPSVAIDLQSQSRLDVIGVPDRLATIVRYIFVQERDISGIGTHLGSSTSYSSAFTTIRCTSGASGGNAPIINLRFVRFITDKGDNAINATTAFQQTVIRDCQFLIGNLSFISSIGSSPVTIENNLFRNKWFWVANSTGSVSVRNNLFRGSTIWFQPTTGTSYYVTDNSFDGAQPLPTGTSGGYNFYHSYNAYVGSGITVLALNTLTTSQVGNQSLGSFTYASSTYGPWYQSTSSLLNAGSRTASAAGLYHHTVLAAQTKETTSTVDIGLHYVSSSSGVAANGDGDGIPDYFEDTDGDGTVDSGETSWQSSSNGTTGVIGLQIFTKFE